MVFTVAFFGGHTLVYLASCLEARTGVPLSNRGLLRAMTAAVAIGMTLAANNAVADMITYALTTSNRPALAGPLAQLTVDLTSPTTAIVTRHHGQGIAAFAGSAASDASPTVSTPVPAAAWLFGSRLLRLIAIARRRVKRSDSPPLPVEDRAAAV